MNYILSKFTDCKHYKLENGDLVLWVKQILRPKLMNVFVNSCQYINKSRAAAAPYLSMPHEIFSFGLFYFNSQLSFTLLLYLFTKRGSRFPHPKLNVPTFNPPEKVGNRISHLPLPKQKGWSLRQTSMVLLGIHKEEFGKFSLCIFEPLCLF